MAQSTTWTGASGRVWQNPNNWSAGVPNLGVDAVIPVTANAPDATGAGAVACRTLTLQTNASLTLAGNTLSIAGDANVAGTIAGPGTIEITGATNTTWSGTSTIPALRLAKTGAATLLWNGNTTTSSFKLLSGVLQMSQSPGQTLTVNGSASFAGGTLQAPAAGLIAVNGSVEFTGTTCNGAAPTIRCAGDWTATAAYAPTLGLVEFVGNGPHLVTGAGNFPDLRIATGATLTSPLDSVTGTITIETGAGMTATTGGTVNDLVIQGTLDSTAGPLDVDGSVTIAGTWTHGAQPVAVGGSLIGSGTAPGTGMWTFDGPGPGTLGVDWTVSSLRIAKTGAATLTLNGTVTTSAFELASGGFLVSQVADQTLTVNGTAFFNGGSLQSSAIGVIDVNGDVVFAGTVCSGVSPTIRCAGQWTATAAYAPTGGLVALDSFTTHVVTGAGNFPNLTVTLGSTATGPLGAVTGTITIENAAQMTTTSGGSIGGLAVLGTGTFDSTAGPLDINGSVAILGTWTYGAQPNTIAGSLTGFGTATGTGMFTFDGGAAATLGVSWTLPSVRIAKTSGATLLLNGNVTTSAFELASGGFQASQIAGQTLTVNGTALFSGGTLSVSSTGVIDVNGNVVFAGTTCNGTTPTFRCAGNWTATAAYAPVGGTVFFDSGAVHVVSGPGNFPNLTVTTGSTLTSAIGALTGTITIESGASLTATSGGSMAGLLVQGTLDSTAGPFDVNGPATVGGTWTHGAQPNSVAGSLTGSGTAIGTGQWTLDGGSTATLGVNWTIGSLRVAKTGSASLLLNGNVTTGAFTLASGSFQVSQVAGQTLTVNGNAQFLGGALLVSSVGVIDVNGNVVFAGTTCSATSPTFRCSGNWTGHPAYAPTAGQLRFDGATNAVLTGSGGLPAVTVDKTGGASLQLDANLTVAGGFQLLNGAVTSVNANRVLTVNGVATFAGGTLTGDALSTIDGNSDIVWAGTSCSAAPTLRCAGNWTGHAAFTPATGQVIFDGTAPQIATAPANYPNLRVQAGATVTTPLGTVTGALAIDAGANLTVTTGGAIAGLDVAGTLTSSAGSLDIAGAVDVDGTWNVGSQPNTIGGNLTGTGTTTGTGLLTLDETAAVTLSGPQTLPPLRIAKPVSSSVLLDGSLAVNGNLTLTSGTFVVSQSAGQTLTVNGDAAFNGGTLLVASIGAIDVNGSVTMAGTTCALTTPTLRCAGNWTGHPAYAPEAGLVVFDGSTPQTVSAAAQFPAVTVASPSTVSCPSGVLVRGLLTIDGALSTTSLDADASVAVNGSWDTGSQPTTIAGSLSGNGTATGTGLLTFDGSTPATLSGPPSLDAVRIAKSSGASLTLNGNVAITGVLELASGTFVLSQVAGQTLTVNGSFTGSGGVLAVAAGGVLDVNGNVTMAGTVCSATTPSILCAGDWIGHAAFAPSAGLVTFDGTTPQNVTTPAQFASMTVMPSSAVTCQPGVVTRDLLTIHGTLSSTSLDADGSVVVFGTWNTGGSPTTIGGGLSGTGTVLGAGVTFDGAAPATLSGPSALGAIRIAKSSGGSLVLDGNITANGALELTSGSFVVSQAIGQTLTVNGNFTGSGGVLAAGATGVLDINGNVTMAGTTCTASPTIRCSGNWTGDAVFVPASGTVIFDGSSPQTVTAAAQFASVTVQTGSSVTCGTNVVMRAQLAVAGNLVSPGVDVDGSVSVTGALDYGAGQATIGGGLSGTGTISGTGLLLLDGPNPAIWSGPASLGGVRVVKSGVGTVVLDGNVTVNGTLEITSGSLVVSQNPAQTLTVTGNALFTGGTLTVASIGTLAVDGNVTFAGTSCTAMPNVECGGDWLSDAAFAPVTGGALRLVGAASTLFGVVPSGGTLRAPGGMVVDGARKVAGTDIEIESPSVDVLPAGTLSAARRRVNLHRAGGPTAVVADGGIEVLDGGRLELGPSTSVTITPAGRLRLVGTPTARAEVAGDAVAGGGYTLVAGGTVAAMNFSILQPGADGLVIENSAVFAAAPEDLRGGRFDFPASSANATLLTITRPAPTDVRYAEFSNTNAVPGTSNVRCTAGAGVSFTNWTGGFAGAAFENDPGNRVDWLPPSAGTVQYFQLWAAVRKVTLEYGLNSTVDTASWQFERTSGAITVSVLELPPAGTQSGQFVDQPLQENVACTYVLTEHLTHGATRVVAQQQATPFLAAPPTNLLTVGPTGNYATPQAAIDAAVLGGIGNPIIQLEPGTHPGFTVSTLPPGVLHVLGSAGVVIDTTAAGVLLQNLASPGYVILTDLTIGSNTSPNHGVSIQNCSATIVLDECTVAAGPTATGLTISASPRALVQRCAVTRGITLDASSFAAVTGTTVDVLQVQGSSYAQTCGTTAGQTNTAPGSTVANLTGAMPDVQSQELVPLGTPTALQFTGEANTLFALFADLQAGFLSLPGSMLELPLLLGYVNNVMLLLGVTDPSGTAASPVLTNDPAFLGYTIYVQGVQVSFAGTLRFSNLEFLSFVP